MVLVGAVGAVASVFLPQLAFNFVGPGRFEVDGLGHFRTLVADPQVQLTGHAPALGAVALIAGVLLAIVICADWVVRWRFADTGLSVLVGVLAGAFACQSVEATGWPNWSWSYGWWVFGASTLCAVAGGIYVHLSGRADMGDRTGRRSSGSS